MLTINDQGNWHVFEQKVFSTKFLDRSQPLLYFVPHSQAGLTFSSPSQTKYSPSNYISPPFFFVLLSITNKILKQKFDELSLPVNRDTCRECAYCCWFLHRREPGYSGSSPLLHCCNRHRPCHGRFGDCGLSEETEVAKYYTSRRTKPDDLEPDSFSKPEPDVRSRDPCSHTRHYDHLYCGRIAEHLNPDDGDAGLSLGHQQGCQSNLLAEDDCF